MLAYGKGGALETIQEERTGKFFAEPTAECLAEAVLDFEKLKLNTEDARQNALRFSRERFKTEMRQMIEREWLKKMESA